MGKPRSPYPFTRHRNVSRKPADVFEDLLSFMTLFINFVHVVLRCFVLQSREDLLVVLFDFDLLAAANFAVQAPLAQFAVVLDS